MRFFFEASNLENHMLDNFEASEERSVRPVCMFFLGTYHYGTCVQAVKPKKYEDCELRRCLSMNDDDGHDHHNHDHHHHSIMRFRR